MSCSPRRVPGTASFAFQQLTKLREAAVPTRRAQAASSARCTVNVPQMNRTDAVPAPYFSRAASPAATTSGWLLKPR
jgi:hypothetical protein